MVLPQLDIDKHIGRRLRLRRNMLHLSQEQLGSALGVTFQQIQKYESGTNKIGAGRLYQLAHLLTTSIEFFFEDLESYSFPKERLAETVTPFEYEKNFDKEIGELIRAFVSIKDNIMRKHIIQFAKMVASSEISS